MLSTPPETVLLQTSPLMRGHNDRAVSAEKSALYRIIMDSFASAKRQFQLHLRPNEVLAESLWSGPPPRIEEVQSALAQLAEWGNLESQPDMARFSTLSDYYRAHYLYPAVARRRGGGIGAGGVRANPAPPGRVADRGAGRHRQRPSNLATTLNASSATWFRAPARLRSRASSHPPVKPVDRCSQPYSHSIVAGGLLLTS
ncbi:hypothetical protein POHY109586_01165 [Polaromonas hydrogenivorans]